MTIDNIEEKTEDQEAAVREAMRKKLEEASTPSESPVEESRKEPAKAAVLSGDSTGEKPGSEDLAPEKTTETAESPSAAEADPAVRIEMGEAEIERRAPEEGLEDRKRAVAAEEERMMEELEKKIGKEEKEPEEKEPDVSISDVKIPSGPAVVKSDIQVQIESILLEDLEDIFNDLPMQKQEQFKKKQEETASKIEAMLSAAKVRVKEILKLIREFLKIIPGLDRYFSEQEAKIKADKILGLEK